MAKHKPIRIPRPKPRNPHAVDAKSRRAGPHRLREDKRAQNKIQRQIREDLEK